MSSSSGTVKTFNDTKGWGFITCPDVDGDIFLHVKDCKDGRPVSGDTVFFDMQDDPVRAGQLNAVNVTGCTGAPREHGAHLQAPSFGGRAPLAKPRLTGPIGDNSGVVKSFNDAKGWGFILCDGADGDIFVHVKDCKDGRPVQGDQVTFDLQDDAVRAGQLNAVNVHGCSGQGQGPAGKGMGGMGGMAGMMFAGKGAPMAYYGAPMMKGGYGAAGYAAPYAAPAAYGKGAMKGYVTKGGTQRVGKGAAKGGGARFRGLVKSYNDAKGWGFIDFKGQDVFLHVKDCASGRPQAGDMVSFETEPDGARGGQLKALNVTGCSGAGVGHQGGGMMGMMRAMPY